MWVRLALTLTVASLVPLGCVTQLADGQFTCQEDRVGTCPAGWLCQCRGSNCDWRCYAQESGYCGNGQLDPGEDCEGPDFVTTCADLGHSGGFAICLPNCTTYCTTCGNHRIEINDQGAGEECDDGNNAAGDGCSPDCTLERCGNGVTDPHELCDDGNNVSGDGCSADCRSDEKCGNGRVDYVTGENCDCGSDAGQLPTGCTGVNGAAAGNCTVTCRLRYCGNGITETGEACDDGNTVSGDRCSADCQSRETCGNGYLDPKTEGCDEGTANSSAPNSACRPDCRPRRCGDGIIDDAAGEQCDGASLGGATCASIGFHAGTLACDPATCQFDVAGCPGRCGDGVKNGAEACDGTDFGTATCTTFGFYTGALACNAACDTVATGGCSQRCGDGVRNGAEACDPGDLTHPADFGGATCLDHGFHGGTLACDAACGTVSTAACAGRCGDGARNGPEACDGAAFGSLSCGSFGYYSGTLACQGQCTQVATGGCAEWCGDGTRNGPGEGCDGLAGRACLDMVGYAAGAAGCDAYCQPIWSDCFTAGWVRSRPGVTRALWGFGPDDIHASGPAGTMHYDGDHWSVLNPGVGVNAIWGSSASNVWAAATTFYRYNGTAWAQVSGAAGGVNRQALWGSSSSSVFSVGQIGTIERFNGTGWSTMTSNTTRPLYGVWGTSAANVFAVGGDSGAGIIHRYTGGASWTAMTLPAGVPGLRGVWVSAGGGWAVGYNGTILRWSGAAWTAAASPTTYDLYRVWGTSDTDVYAVGIGEGALNNPKAGVILHYDGLSWEVLSTDATAAYFAVWGSAANDVYVAGTDPLGTVMLHYVGDSWRTTPGTNGGPNNAIWGSSASDIWIAGGGVATLQHYNGSAWSTAAGSGNELYGLYGITANNIWAVGTLDTVQHYTGSWSTSTTGSGATLRGVWGNAANNVYAVGNIYTTQQVGYVLRWNGTAWSTAYQVNGHDLMAVTGTAAGRVFAVGRGGTIVRYDGGSWAPMASGVTVDLEAVWASSDGHVFAGGYSSTVLHFNGSAWVSSQLGASGGSRVRSLWGASATDVYAGLNDGRIYHFDGSGWSPMEQLTINPIFGLWGASHSDVWASAGLGTILHFTGRIPAPPGGACARPVRAYCGGTFYADNASGPNAFTSYCGQAKAEGAPELYYRFEAPVSGTITVSLAPAQGDLDLIVVGDDAAGGCDVTQCVGRAQTSTSGGGEQVSFTAAAGQVYYFIVDGPAGNVTGTTLQVQCPRP